MGVSIEFLQSELMHELKGLEYRLKDTKPVMKAVAEMMESSIKQNFRDNKIRPESKRVKKEGGETLRLTGRLMNSIVGKGYEGRAVVMTPKAGTNVAYALAHQFGFKGTVEQQVSAHERTISQAFGKAIDPKRIMVKAHPRSMRMNLPARPFMKLDPGDFAEAKTMIMQHIMGGNV